MKGMDTEREQSYKEKKKRIWYKNDGEMIR
jgi:hypothetical protein